MAYRKWLNQEMNKIMVEMYTTVKKECPDILVISDDPIAAGQPYDFSKWKSCCDIVTHQLYPGGSPYRASFGYVTKLVKDISDADEFWPCLHVEEYASSFNPQETLDLISESFRNGATGIHYYLKDTIGVRNANKYMRTEYYGAPERWNIEMAAIQQLKKMNKLKFPEADFAILFSCDSYCAMPPESRTENAESAYTVLGPGAGSWFKFINDYQIDRNEIVLNQFKAVYIPYANYQSVSVVNKIKDYVHNGGTVITGDPEVFAFDTNGVDNSSVRNEIFGIKKLDSTRVKNIRYNGSDLPVKGKTFDIETDNDTEVIASFDNNKPAVVLNEYGKGKAYYFATNPFTYKMLASKEWTDFFKSFQRKLGLQVEHKIWRFNLPQDLIKPVTLPEGKCLTNNHIFWKQFEPLATYNINTMGSYSYSVAPDEIADNNTDGNIAFANGKLTNRQKAPKAGNVDCNKSHLNEWIVKYKNEKPFEIIFDLNDVYDLSSAAFFYSGQMPEVTASVSKDNKKWKLCDNLIKKTFFTEDVFDIKLEPISEKARYLKLNFGPRDQGNSLTLAEIEIWTK
ncbi:MAG: beta-galactosidase trimerization domain-containing protein [Phycisphaerales bacterium]